MKILLMPAGCYRASGAYLSACGLAIMLKEKYNAQVLVLLPREGDGTKILRDNDIDYVVVKSYSWLIPVKYNGCVDYILSQLKLILKTVLNVHSKFKIKKLISSFKPDIVHINELGTYVGAEVSETLNIPTVWHFREFNEEDQGLKIWRKKLAGRLFAGTDKIFCVSNAVYAKYHTLYPESSMTTIYDGVRVEQFGYVEPKQNECINIICSGALYHHKRQYVLIRAAQIIKEKCEKNFHISILGEGYAEDEYKKLTDKLGLDDVITFEGFHSDVVPYYQRAHIAVVPSVNEAFGRVTVEAMLCGAHVVGADSGGTGELIAGEFGTVFQPDNVEDLAQKLIYVIKNDEYRLKIARRARRRAEEMFSVERNADEVYREYLKILNGK